MKTLSLVNSALIATTALLATSSVAEAITFIYNVDPLYYQNLGSYYPSVGRLQPNSSSNFCSGTLVSSNWVLTAGHCTNDLNLNFGSNVASFHIGRYIHSVDSYVTPSGWLQSEDARQKAIMGLDIALLKLNTSVTDVSPVSPYTGFNEIGEEATLVGFGVTGDGYRGVTNLNLQNQIRYGARNTVDATGQHLKMSDKLLLTDFDNPDDWRYSQIGDYRSLPLEGSIVNGDSGGALFIDGYLAGVTSFGFDNFFDYGENSPNGSYGDYSAFTRVSSYSNWINCVVSGGASSFCSIYEPSLRVTNTNLNVTLFSAENNSTQDTKTVTEPPISIALFSLLGMLGFLRRR